MNLVGAWLNQIPKMCVVKHTLKHGWMISEETNNLIISIYDLNTKTSVFDFRLSTGPSFAEKKINKYETTMK